MNLDRSPARAVLEFERSRLAVEKRGHLVFLAREQELAIPELAPGGPRRGGLGNDGVSFLDGVTDGDGKKGDGFRSEPDPELSVLELFPGEERALLADAQERFLLEL